MAHFQYRSYDSRSFRWINRDPIQENGGLNLYAFIENDVINAASAFKRVLPEATVFGYSGYYNSLLGKRCRSHFKRHACADRGNLQYRTNNALIQTFKVNTLNQLTNVTRTGTLTVAGTTTSAATNVTVNTSNAVLYFDYTFASTNHTLADGTNTFTAIGKDALGRVDTNVTTLYLPASPTFFFDSNGNLTYDGYKALEYDDENQLTRITTTNLWKSEFTYDGKLRRRVRREFTWQNGTWVLTNEVRYVYDGNLVLQERNTWNIPTITYTRGNDLSGSLEGAGGIGGLLALSQLSTLNSQHYYYYADANGNVTALFDNTERVVARYLYDPFGTLLSMNGLLAEANLYRFSSKEAHQPSGLIYYLYRYYESSLQRWSNRDPLDEPGFERLHRGRSDFLGGWNNYSFCGNSPVDKQDAYGLVVADTLTSTIIHCARMPGEDFVSCVCLFAEDSDKCERELGPCLRQKPGDILSMCECACGLIKDKDSRKSCLDACKKAKAVKKWCEKIKKKEKEKKKEEPSIP